MRHITAAFVLVALSATSAAAGTPEPGYTDTSAASSLGGPSALAFMPDGRMLVTEKSGGLVLVDGGNTTLVTIPVCDDSEMGLLGIALDPDFALNGFIYLYRTAPGSSPPCGGTRFNEVVRVTMALDDTVALGSLTVLLTGIQTDNGNHDGGVLRMGADDKLYVGVGDTGLGDNQGGPGSSTNPYSQDLNQLEGKILRLELDGSVPIDNPFVGQVGVREEILAYGFRNPFRMSFDPATDLLWVGDVGDLTFEEIDVIAAGGNYSWPYCEAGEPGACEQPGDIAPVFVYPHSGPSSLGSCVIGGSFAGAAFGPLTGDYVFGDCTSDEIYRATLNGTRDDITGSPVLIATNGDTPSDFVTGPDGAIYYAAIGGGEIRRISLAVGDQLLSGKKMTLKTAPPNDDKKQLKVQSKDASINLGLGNLTTSDPVLNGGTLRVVSTAGDVFDTTYPLVAGSWDYFGDAGDNKGYRFKDTTGTIKSVIVKPAKLLKATGKGAGLGHTLGTNPDPVQAVLTLGDQTYCLEFDGGAFVATKSYVASDTGAPGACPP